MDLDFPILVLSDIHLGHPASYAHEAEQLRPLFKNFSTVVFNGDTAEILWPNTRELANKHLEDIGNICLEEGAAPIYVSGNHDPMVSSANHLDLYGGAMLITHGDILFHELAPWSREANITGPAHTEALKRLGRNALSDFEQRLFAVKEASISIEMHTLDVPRSWWTKIAMILREGMPPWRAFRILKFWQQTPHRANLLADIFRPMSKFVLIGHTHRAGVWDIGDRTIINTGSYLPLSGRTAVLLEKDKLEVRKVDLKNGEFVLGAKVAERAVEPVIPDVDPGCTALDETLTFEFPSFETMEMSEENLMSLFE